MKTRICAVAVIEKAGLNTESVEKMGVYEDDEPDKNGEMTHYVFHSFKAKSLGGQAVTSEEFPFLKWIDRRQLA